jgi:outer membrane protein OmpA-like peptidoglycan-associated protein
MRILLIGFVVFVGWSALSTHIYVCKIRGLCPREKTSLAEVIEPKKNLITTVEVEEKIETPKDWVMYFAFDKSDFIPGNEVRVHYDKVNAYIQHYPQTTIHITGHTDAVGTMEYNQALGIRRAQSMQLYFESMGMPADKIKIESKGEKEPVANNNSDEGRAKNRRTVVTIK